MTEVLETDKLKQIINKIETIEPAIPNMKSLQRKFALILHQKPPCIVVYSWYTAVFM